MAGKLSTSVEQVNPPVKTSLATRLLSYVWDSDSHLKTPEERKLIRKLDAAVLSICCLSFFCKYLDQNNLSNAYISGMKEDLQMNGNQYTYAGTMYTIAYAIMQIPSTMIVQKVRPSYWLCFCEVGWAAFTFAQAGTKNVGQLYVFRFMVGLFESAFFPVALYLMGSWYNKHELAKRIAIMHMTSPLGSAFSGYLQAAVYQTLDGKQGLAGWRWLYIVCGVITIPVALAVFFLIPDHPSNSRAFYLSPDEREFANQRVLKLGKAAPKPLNRAILKRVFTGWHWYAFVAGYVLYGTSCQASGYFGIWLKAENFSVAKRNIIPTGTNLISAFSIFMWGFGADLTGSRFAFVFLPLCYGLIPNGILAVWPKSLHLKEFAFLTTGVQLMTAVFYTWANEVCAGDNEERALVISSMNGLQYAVAAWLPIVIFPQTQAPTFRRGFPATFGFVVAGLITIAIIKLLADREARRRGPSVLDTEEQGKESVEDDKASDLDLTDEKLAEPNLHRK